MIGLRWPTGEEREAEEARQQDMSSRPADGDDGDLAALREALESLRKTVENDHAHRLRRIETDLRWVIVLVVGQTIALLGAAATNVLGG